ncbi:amidohydrolase family protein [Sphingomonas koreensis]|jgi:imidazolonepropionase-like amidohydrolase|uniref:Amidohydrolase family protein n=1 Tax=Sphingomonas koreensis TaxID=93064 RepID=A0A1L6JDQ5_9SPHN|nr:amidohydrolase family protein [Sphingomonas koreensis]APR54062.1 Xaa-Pro dipeptidase [Sphingomonas koreensis]MDC7809035.1 amidohydrolase family protein [Sphingomonas koreensis]RSU18696.1 amidohydrolase family protein [Sphingomonas koreensis]RSU25470.1 amidohydrolase family protein [Sphingomonas koreensis]RSU25793.1 amidohydrolase family protein [Sphingomonas koreensis]
MKRQMIVAAVAVLAATPAAAETVVVTADRMVDVVAGTVVEHPAVFIEDGRIKSIADARTVRWGSDVRHIDLSGKTILPGLIDMHVHLDANPLYGGYTGLQFTDSFWAIQGVANARAMLKAGFTTIRNVGSENYADVGYKQAIEEGLIEGPRIVPAAHALGATGGHCDQTYLPPSFKAKGVAVGDGPQELRVKVREQRKYGAEVIKICATGGVFSRNTEPGQQQLSEEEMRAIADEAHQWGLRVAAHAHGAAGIKAAIRAGVDTIEHVSLVDDEGVRLAVARKQPVWFSMDIFNTDYTQAEGKKNGVLEDNLRKDREVAQIQRDNFRKAHAAGVKMVFGTDAGVMPHGTAAGQFRTMVTYGMTPLEAIRAATLNAAEALGRSRDVGAIAVGRYGDIVAVDGDPLKDVGVLTAVKAVIKGGKLVSGD